MGSLVEWRQGVVGRSQRSGVGRTVGGIVGHVVAFVSVGTGVFWQVELVVCMVFGTREAGRGSGGLGSSCGIVAGHCEEKFEGMRLVGWRLSDIVG